MLARPPADARPEGCPCFPARETALRPRHGFGAAVSQGTILRPRTRGHCMSVLGFPGGGELLLCGWMEGEQVRAEVFAPADLELVRAFGDDEARWLAAFRAHGTILQRLRSTAESAALP